MDQLMNIFTFIEYLEWNASVKYAHNERLCDASFEGNLGFVSQIIL